MPCDTVARTKVEFLPKSTDVALLKKALAALGYRVTEGTYALSFSNGYQAGSYDKSTGKLSMPEQWDTSAVKRAYAEETVNFAAQENGWEIEWSTNAEGIREAAVERRNF